MRARTITVKTVKFNLPPQWLTDSYELKRDGEIRKKQKEVQRMLHSMTDSEQEENQKKDEKKRKAIEMKNDGYSEREIAKEIRTSQPWVHKVVAT